MSVAWELCGTAALGCPRLINDSRERLSHAGTLINGIVFAMILRLNAPRALQAGALVVIIGERSGADGRAMGRWFRLPPPTTIRRTLKMISTPHDGSAELRLCDALLGLVDNGRLDSLQQSLRGFNHRFRNLLNSLRMSFYLAKRSGFQADSGRWGEIDQAYREVEEFQTRLQTIYQAMPLTLIDGRFGALAAERESTWADWFRQNGNELVLNAPDPEMEGRFDPMYLGTALDGFIAWRAAAIPRGGRATLRWTTNGDGFAIDWSERATASTIEPSGRARPPAETLPVTTASLSLPFLARVAVEHGGGLSWTREPDVEARIRWPLTAPKPRTEKWRPTPT